MEEVMRASHVLWSQGSSSIYPRRTRQYCRQRLFREPYKQPTFVVSGTPPLMTWNSSGSRYLGSSSASSWLNAGVCSDGFRTAAFPAAIALTCTATSEPPAVHQSRYTVRQSGRTRGLKSRNAGKLKGEMMRITPLGSGQNLGLIGVQLMLNAVRSGLTHLSTLWYPMWTSASTGPMSNLR